MTSQWHTEHRYNGRLEAIEFRPRWSTSDGLHHEPLGIALWHRFPIFGWSLTKGGTLKYHLNLDPDGPDSNLNPLELVDQCQRYIYSLMDEATHHIKLTQAIAEVEAERMCVP